jgi:transcriptional regulator with XRE-family HTH domain
MDANKKPNDLLRRERKLRGWTQEQVADALDQLCQEEPRVRRRDVVISDSMVSRWERGIHPPSPFHQRMLCQLFEKSAEALGFVDPLPSQMAEPPSPLQHFTSVLSNRPQAISTALSPIQAIDWLCAYADDVTPDQQLGMWLASSAQNLMPLFDARWTPHMVLEALHTLLPGVHAMSQISRRTFGQHLLRLGIAALLSGVPIPTGKHISAEERMELHNALGESIATSWRLIQTSRPDQILALGHAQLSFVRQSSSHLYPKVRPLFYSGVYRLIGAALHFQGRYDEAYQAHEQAYLTALEGMDVWNMAQSRQWQADALKAQGRYDESLQTTDAALRLISSQTDPENIRTTAHLLSSTAEVAALLGDRKEVQFRLDTSQELAEQFSEPHEEFDQIGWHQLAGTCALILEQYDTAIVELQGAVNMLPVQWTLRHATAVMPLAIAYARLREKTECLTIAEKATEVLERLSSPNLNRQFTGYMQQELPQAFQNDGAIRSFLSDVQHRLMLREPSTSNQLN